MNVPLFVLKLCSIVIAAVAGVLGTLKPFKEKRIEGGIEREVVTSWGWFAVVGIGVGTLIALGTQILESRIQQQQALQTATETLAQTKRLERILQGIDRSLHPFEVRSAFFEVRVPLPDPSVPEYSRALLSALDDYYARYEQVVGVNTIGPAWNGLRATGISGTKPIDAHIERGSRLFPLEYTPASLLLAHRELEIFVFKSPIGPESLREYRHPPPDLDIIFSSKEDWDLVYDYDRKQLTLGTVLLPPERHKRGSTGRIVSSLDLAGAQFVVRMPNPSRLNPETDAITIPLYAKFSDPRMTLDVGTRRFEFVGKEAVFAVKPAMSIGRRGGR